MFLGVNKTIYTSKKAEICVFYNSGSIIAIKKSRIKRCFRKDQEQTIYFERPNSLNNCPIIRFGNKQFDLILMEY